MCPLLRQPERGPGGAPEERSLAGRQRRQDGGAADEARREGEEETSPLHDRLPPGGIKLLALTRAVVLAESPREDLPHSEGPVHGSLHAPRSVLLHSTHAAKSIA